MVRCAIIVTDYAALVRASISPGRKRSMHAATASVGGFFVVRERGDEEASFARTSAPRQIEFSYLLLTIIGVVSRRYVTRARLRSLRSLVPRRILGSAQKRASPGSSPPAHFRETLAPPSSSIPPIGNTHGSAPGSPRSPRDYSRRPRTLASLIALRAPRLDG